MSNEVRKCPSCGSLNTIDNYTENKYMKCLDCGYVDFWKPRWKLIKVKTT